MSVIIIEGNLELEQVYKNSNMNIMYQFKDQDDNIIEIDEDVLKNLVELIKEQEHENRHN